MENQACFRCHQHGHWMRDCPLRTPKKLSFPSIQCPCGAGLCSNITSRTPKNPGRRFYKCPSPTPCKFFKWCDEVTDKELSFSPEFPFPECPCGAGTCRKETALKGPYAGRSYFVCRVKRGFGACSFSQLEKSEEDMRLKEARNESRERCSPHLGGNGNDGLYAVNEGQCSRRDNMNLEHGEMADVESSVAHNASSFSPCCLEKNERVTSTWCRCFIARQTMNEYSVHDSCVKEEICFTSQIHDKKIGVDDSCWEEGETQGNDI